jgi:hypothetical protein
VQAEDGLPPTLQATTGPDAEGWMQASTGGGDHSHAARRLDRRDRPMSGSPYPTSAELMARASEQTGLSDFGAPTFRVGLDQMLQSLEADARLSEAGRAMVEPMMRRRLVNRLQIEDWFKSHPGAETAPITGPICITGLPRTGTTALGNMMSLDPQFRSLRAWEQSQPCPPPDLATEAEDPRRLAALRHTESMARDQEQAAMHLYDVDATVEDVEVLGLEFSAQQMTFPIFGYHAWWRDADMRPTFAYHRRAALLLQSSRPPNLWLFKAPHHKFHLEALVDAYPEARFVFTHRDPAKAAPSYVSFATSHYPPGTLDNHDLRDIARHIHNHLLIGMQRAMAARGRLGDHRFVDVQQREIESDPLGTLARIYDFLGLELRPEMREAVVRWGEANHAGAHGQHRYTAEQYGLSVEQIRSDYDFYIRHFDIPVAR